MGWGSWVVLGGVTFQDTRELSFFKGLFGPKPGVFANHPSLLSIEVSIPLVILHVPLDLAGAFLFGSNAGILQKLAHRPAPDHMKVDTYGKPLVD
jgi:hypothetical protein